jgi:hypothetical protein
MEVSKAYDEFVSKRCEEIMLDDEKYNGINSCILNLESELKKTLSPEQIKKYNLIEEMNIKSICDLAICIYKTSISDIKEAQNRLSWF